VERPNSAEESPGRTTTPGEFEVIDRLRARFEAVAPGRFTGGGVPPHGEVWIGDDAAVVASGGTGHQVLATDLVVAGVHVDLRLSSLADAGYKALMVTVSDLAAMGAHPDHALVSVAAPPGTDLDLLGAGLAEAAGETGCLVVGGDLSAAPVLVVSTAVRGSFGPRPGSGPPGEDPWPLLRSGARAGDHLLVTGPLGGSAAGLRLLRASVEAAGGRDATTPTALPGHVADTLRRAHRRPRARVAEGEMARVAGARAAIDVSDGLISDLGHLARASGVGVALTGIPTLPGATADEALHGGEEYELVLATPDPGGLAAAFAGAGLRPPLLIGRCTDRPGECTVDGVAVVPAGWQHRF
jgi:thiamine-monophosphate kinase